MCRVTSVTSAPVWAGDKCLSSSLVPLKKTGGSRCHMEYKTEVSSHHGQDRLIAQLHYETVVSIVSDVIILCS